MEHYFETLRECPSCNRSAFTKQIRCTDYTYSKEPFTICFCDKCSLSFTNPRPDEKGIGIYYDNPEYVSHTDTKKGLLFRIYGIVKGYTLDQKRKLLEELTTERSALDYGAGSGDFSNELAKNGWGVSSYEPDSDARKLIRQKNESIQLVDSLDNLPDQSISAIALWHVLEHVHRLQETIKEFNRILTDDGKLVVAVPNLKSHDAQFYKEEWAAYDVPRHLYHFSPESIEALMQPLGFRLVDMKPMWFDSYYVSLLSEKNSTSDNWFRSLFGWGRAFIIGTVSNLKALGSTEKCSSVTYIFEKAL